MAKGMSNKVKGRNVGAAFIVVQNRTEELKGADDSQLL
jgi:hypothetical protein